MIRGIIDPNGGRTVQIGSTPWIARLSSINAIIA